MTKKTVKLEMFLRCENVSELRGMVGSAAGIECLSEFFKMLFRAELCNLYISQVCPTCYTTIGSEEEPCQR
jgi:hypothetical protein